MGFLLKFEIQEKVPQFEVKKGEFTALDGSAFIFFEDRRAETHYHFQFSDGGVLHVFGDLITKEAEVTKHAAFSPEQVLDWKGNFNFVHIKDGEVKAGNSNFSLLPLYYHLDQNQLTITNRLVYMTAKRDQHCKVYLLERLLFNYSLTHHTHFKGVRSVPSFHCITQHDQSISIKEYFDWRRLVTESPKEIDRSKDDVIDLFSSIIHDYFPDEKFHCAFTSGFDSRSIFALASSRSKNEVTGFSFGTQLSDDVVLPSQLCKKYNLKFDSIILGNDYIYHEYWNSVSDIIVKSDGLSTLSRAHYSYASQYLSTQSNYFLSGNYGSELFRAVHSDGAITASLLFDLVEGIFPETLASLIMKYPKYAFLTDSDWELAFQQLHEELKEKVKYFNGDFSTGLRMYYWVWLVSIPNYFGGELLMQQHHIKHRTPFADFDFFRFIQGTEFSGAYEDFKQKNLMKRMRGQKFYPFLLEAIESPLLYETTGKGYKPIDIIDIKRFPNLALGKFFRQSNAQNADPFLAKKAFEMNKINWETQLGDAIFSDVSEWDSCSDEIKKNLISIYLFFTKLQN